MNTLKTIFVILLPVFFMQTCSQSNLGKKPFNPDEMMVRMAEIEIDAKYFDEYVAILKEEAANSVRLEPGVICIYPMFEKEAPTQIRLLEIYATREAYETHLQTQHFQYYKTSTLKMVKSLKLVDMGAIDSETMPDLFTKLKNLTPSLTSNQLSILN